MAENKISMEDKAKLGELFATAIEKGELSEADMENVAGGLSETTKKRLAKGAKVIGKVVGAGVIAYGAVKVVDKGIEKMVKRRADRSRAWMEGLLQDGFTYDVVE